MIRAKGITFKIAGGQKIIDNISFNVLPGKLTSIIGKNGAGKSTALKALCGDISLNDGQILFEDIVLSNVKIGTLASKRAVVYQKSNLEFSFSVLEVVALGRSPFSGIFNSKQDDVIVKQCLEKVDAYHLADHDYTTLSGGEQQRVQFARALAQIWDTVQENKPSYLLLDEPLASLDVAHQHELMLILKQLCLKNVGVLIVIHDLNLAAQYSDTVLIMKDGKIGYSGSPDKVFTESIISESFDYPVNIIPHPRMQCPLIIAASPV